MPQYYYIPKDCLRPQGQNTALQRRVPTAEGEGENYFLWGQAVYVVMKLLGEKGCLYLYDCLSFAYLVIRLQAV